MLLNSVLRPVLRPVMSGVMDVSSGAIGPLQRIASIGDSITRSNYTPYSVGGNVGYIRRWTGFGAWLPMAAWKTAGLVVPDIYAMEGYSGQTSAQILSSLQPAGTTENWGPSGTIPVGITSRSVDYVVDCSGTNSLTTYEGAADAAGATKTAADRLALWNYIKSIGAIPIALSLFPRSSPALYADKVPAYNTAIKALADANGVTWVDVYTPCVDTGGVWKAGYTLHNNADDPLGLHPSYEATKLIAAELSSVLSAMIARKKKLPRVEVGKQAEYAATVFVPGGTGNYWKQYCDGAFPNLSGIVNRANLQANATEALVTTIDITGGGTEEFRKPSAATGAYADWVSTALTVVGGQKYIAFADCEIDISDNFLATEVGIIEDGTFRFLCCYALSEKESTQAQISGLMRISFEYEIPPLVTSIRLFIAMNRSAGGLAGNTDKIRIANFGNLRIE